MKDSKSSKFKTPILATSLLAVMAGGIGIGLFLGKTQYTEPNSQNRTPEEIELIKSIPKPSSNTRSLSQSNTTQNPEPRTQNPINALAGLNDLEQSPRVDILILDHLFEEVNALFHDMPTGTHDEIVSFLLGANPRSFAYFQADNPVLDEDKKIVDRWGTPYFFHVLGRHEMEVRSAGPDMLHWSEDDVVSENSTNAPIAQM